MIISAQTMIHFHTYYSAFSSNIWDDSFYGIIRRGHCKRDDDYWLPRYRVNAFPSILQMRRLECLLVIPRARHGPYLPISLPILPPRGGQVMMPAPSAMPLFLACRERAERDFGTYVKFILAAFRSSRLMDARLRYISS